jgi:hypothetical protein
MVWKALAEGSGQGDWPNRAIGWGGEMQPVALSRQTGESSFQVKRGNYILKYHINNLVHWTD